MTPVEDDSDDVLVGDSWSPAQGVDRDALYSTLDELAMAVHAHAGSPLLAPPSITDFTNRILALVRPVEGVVLSPEEARLVLGWYPGDRAIENPDERALAARLEVS